MLLSEPAPDAVGVCVARGPRASAEELVAAGPFFLETTILGRIFHYIEGWYNARRLLSSLGYLRHVDSEKNLHHAHRQAA
ncbi:MAG TPA: hypothetical protein VGR26_12810 [Acidimicrobiales bacterium]|nr:hypothetical protein [Acidimicrobiales bacterium]